MTIDILARVNRLNRRYFFIALAHLLGFLMGSLFIKYCLDGEWWAKGLCFAYFSIKSSEFSHSAYENYLTKKAALLLVDGLAKSED